MNSVPAPPRARNVAKGPNSLSSLGRALSDLRASRRWRGGRTRRSHAIEATPRARRPRVPLLRVDARLWVSSLLRSAAAARAGACPGRFRRKFRRRCVSLGRCPTFRNVVVRTPRAETCVRVAAAAAGPYAKLGRRRVFGGSRCPRRVPGAVDWVLSWGCVHPSASEHRIDERHASMQRLFV